MHRKIGMAIVLAAISVFSMVTSAPTGAASTWTRSSYASGSNHTMTTSRIVGVVRDSRAISTRRIYPNDYSTVSGATVQLINNGNMIRSDRDGRFTFNVALNRSPYATVNLVVEAVGFGRWTYVGFPIRPGETSYLDVDLKATDQTVHPPTAEETQRQQSEQQADSSDKYTGRVHPGSSCSGYFSNSNPPSTIKVYRRSLGYVQAYDFNFYVKHVLPSEWIPSWLPEALKAGAIAVKNYGWYWVNNWRGGSYNGQCYDVDDTTNYQVFNPSYSTSSTDAAVDATWTILALRSGSIFEASYIAGTPRCARINGWQMYQWGSQQCARNDYGYQQIVTTFYDNISFSSPPPLTHFAVYTVGSQQHVVSVDSSHAIHHWYWTSGVGWVEETLSGSAIGSPAAYTFGAQQHIVYRGVDGLIHHAYWNSGTWYYETLSDPAGGDPAVYVTSTQQHIVYRASDGTLHHQYWTPGVGWTLEGIGDSVMGAVAAYVTGSQQHVVYRASDGSIHHQYWSNGWILERLGDAGAHGDPAAYVTGTQQHIVYVASDNTIHHQYWTPGKGWVVEYLGDSAQGMPSVYVLSTQQHIVYRATDNTIHHQYWSNGWALEQLGVQSANDTAAFVDSGGGQHIVYQADGTNQIWQQLWNNGWRALSIGTI